MKFKFSKMHGAGNDFVVIDAVRQTIQLTPEQCRYIADRRFGIGCDQILIVEPPQSSDADFKYRIMNADGSEVEQCGNGSRAFVRFVREQGLTQKNRIRVETLGGLIEPYENESGYITVDMGAPRLGFEAVHFETAGLESSQEGNSTLWRISEDSFDNHLDLISMGNPHAVQIVSTLEDHVVASVGQLLESHTRFKQRVNVGFMQIEDSHHINLRVYERGAGETLACGTGACAAVVSGIQRGKLESPVNVKMRGGELIINWAGEGQSVFLSGPAVTVFEGEIEI